MDTKLQDIANDMARVVGKRSTGIAGGAVTHTIMSGTVKSVESDQSCTVLPIGWDESAPLDGITISVSIDNSNGVYGVPSTGAACLICEVDGGGGWELLKASSYDKWVMKTGGSTVTMTDGLIQLNDGSKGGLTITPELKTQLDKLNMLVQHLVSVINGATINEPGSGSASALQTALKAAIAADSVGDFSNIENKKVKHG